MGAYESFREQILKNKMGELRTREKTEFYLKVKEAAYRDETKRLSSESMKPVVAKLVKTAMLHRALETVSSDVNSKPQNEERSNE